MNYGVYDLLMLGLVIIFAATVALTGMVHAELGPAARLNGRKRFLLTMALGTGVLAFGLKLLLIIGLSSLVVMHPKHEVVTYEPRPVNTQTAHYNWVNLPGIRTYSMEQGVNRPSGYVWEALPVVAPSPDTNPSTQAKIELGRKLFNDQRLSFDQTLSCASCHGLFDAAGADARATAVGISQQSGPRNTPTVWNSAFQAELFWDGRADSLEDQAKGPLLNPIEMGMPSYESVVNRVTEQAGYRDLFDDAFGADTEINIDRIADAIAAYERTLITPDTPYDRFVQGDLNALSPAQIRGMALFESMGCVQCHSGPNFSAASLFDGQVPRRIFPVNPTAYEQQYDLLVSMGDQIKTRGVWRVPSLRNVALTGPWFHNGSVDDLAEVVSIMASVQLGWSGHYLMWSDTDRAITEIDRPVPSDQQVEDIVAFLHALSSDRLTRRQSDQHM